MRVPWIDWVKVDRIIDTALEEDIGEGDVTTNTLFDESETASAYLMSKATGIVAGLNIAERVFLRLDAGVEWRSTVEEGSRIKPRQVIAEFSGSLRALLTGERLALNIAQRLSGIATQTAKFIEAVDGLPVKILDTRKTLPGLRVLEKYAVAVGGGTNHRFGLFDGIMIKDNHIKIAGGIQKAVAKMRASNPRNLLIEVETSNLDEVKAALAADADIIMLDNMSNATMSEAVKLIGNKAITEASGGVTLNSVRSIAETGVDCISVGALTHSTPALDISMYFR
ncbi:MAG: carboxylating nicotinate-nucleotide diphosphorylase [Calditrichia bacterium]|nr:carboxylating nicotinate-nucleotide diphosphorylase [Calditrichota bacterium]MCB0268098.1 carboxylating nicotinate-nucleotide diphosphorylase [Calditrichota bacterium]MCB0287979.1 carboxylating nicotinate-nucleotide diphosphorylase [Calditrichota bacterium]MCB9068031.1 carboxylating nicotinate-nucleotide diphosphorylase [Calditrichia bacterium]